MKEPANNRIMIADAESAIVETLCWFFSEHGYRTSGCTDGQQALEKSREWKPFLLIADLNLPKLSAIELIDLIKAEQLTPRVILMCGIGSELAALQALRNGGWNFLRKPLYFEEALRVVKDVYEKNMYNELQNRYESSYSGFKSEVQETVQRHLAKFQKQSERMMLLEKAASFGSLANIIFHEINNPLQAIAASLELAKNMAQEHPKVRTKIELCLREMERLMDLAESMRRFKSDENMPMEEIQIADTFRDVINISKTYYESRGVEIDFDAESSLPSILGSSPLLEQAWFNYFKNAFEAILEKKQRKGKIEVRLFLSPDENIEVRIKDNGVGVSERELQYIRHPLRFYSTKPEGCGIGLVEAQRIIHLHGGRVEADSQFGKFTEIRLHFPISPKKGVENSKA